MHLTTGRREDRYLTFFLSDPCSNNGGRSEEPDRSSICTPSANDWHVQTDNRN